MTIRCLGETGDVKRRGAPCAKVPLGPVSRRNPRSVKSRAGWNLQPARNCSRAETTLAEASSTRSPLNGIIDIVTASPIRSSQWACRSTRLEQACSSSPSKRENPLTGNPRASDRRNSVEPRGCGGAYGASRATTGGDSATAASGTAARRLKPSVVNNELAKALDGLPATEQRDDAHVRSDGNKNKARLAPMRSLGSSLAWRARLGVSRRVPLYWYLAARAPTGYRARSTFSTAASTRGRKDFRIQVPARRRGDRREGRSRFEIYHRSMASERDKGAITSDGDECGSHRRCLATKRAVQAYVERSNAGYKRARSCGRAVQRTDCFERKYALRKKKRGRRAELVDHWVSGVDSNDSSIDEGFRIRWRRGEHRRKIGDRCQICRRRLLEPTRANRRG